MTRVYAKTKKKSFLFCFVFHQNKNQNKNNKTKKCMRKQKLFSAAFRREISFYQSHKFRLYLKCRMQFRPSHPILPSMPPTRHRSKGKIFLGERGRPVRRKDILIALLDLVELHAVDLRYSVTGDLTPMDKESETVH